MGDGPTSKLTTLSQTKPYRAAKNEFPPKPSVEYYGDRAVASPPSVSPATPTLPARPPGTDTPS